MDIVQDSLQYWIKGGIILVPIACVCFFIWLNFIRLNRHMKPFLSVSDRLIEESQHILQDKVVKGESSAQIKGFMKSSGNRFLNAVYSVMHIENRDLLDSIEKARMRESRMIRRRLILLKALVASSPLMGLLGTVLGMITTFNALGKGMTGATNIMASGISKALITTQFGLIVALPGIFIISILERNRTSIEVRFNELRTHFISGIRKRDAV